MKFKCNLTMTKSDVVFVLGTQTSLFFVVVVAGSEGAGRWTHTHKVARSKDRQAGRVLLTWRKPGGAVPYYVLY